MRQSREGFWTVTGSLAAVVALILSIVWQQNKPSQEDPDPSESSPDFGDIDDGTAFEASADSDGEALGWEPYGDAFTLWLAPTIQDGTCQSQAFDLDDDGTYSWYQSAEEFPEFAELSWQSCGDDEPGYLYGRWAWSTGVEAGGAQDPAACEEAITDESYLKAVVDRDDPTSVEGCLYTSDGRFATVAFEYIGPYGDFTEAHLAVTLWTWN